MKLQQAQSLTCALISLLIAAGAAGAESRSHCPDPLLELDFDGNVVGGSKQTLIDATQRGEPIRVGWDVDLDENKTADLSHWSDAVFLSVFEGEVFTQVETIHRQRPLRDDGAIELPPDFDEWHGIIGTNGLLQGRFERAGAVRHRAVRSVWCSAAPAWRAVYTSGTRGEDLAGSKAMLLSSIRAGEEVRIGWGLARESDGEKRSVEHVVAPVFITIVNESDVVAQLPEHVAQRSYWNTDQAVFDKGAVMWRGVVSTTGTFDAIWVNRSSGETVRRSPQRAIFTWYVKHEARSAESLAVERGVVVDDD